MPFEVISLLSSPEAGASSPPRAKTAIPPPARSSLPSRRLDYDDGHDDEPDDILDLTDDTLHQSIRTASATAPSNAAKRGIRNDWLLSDDFSIPTDIHPSPCDIDHGPAPKRQRLATTINRLGGGRASRLTQPADLAANLSRPRALQPSGGLNSALEDIEISSPAPVNAGHSKSRPPNLDDDDLFVHSSPLEKEDPRESTSALQDMVDDSDPFATSPVRGPHKQPPSPKKFAAWDPISSSLPIPARDRPASPRRPLQRSRSEVIILDDSDGSTDPHGLSEGDFPDIADIDISDAALNAPTRKARPLPRKPAARPPSKAPSNPRPRPPASAQATEEKARDREEKAAAREAEKERKLKEKERAKEERAREREKAAALAEVNKIRTDKKVSAPEMIVDFPNTLNHVIKLQAEQLLKDLDIESTTCPCPVKNVVRWRRKVRSVYNEDLGIFEPAPPRVEPEKYAMVLLPAAEFVDLSLDTSGETNNLEAHVLRMKRHFPDHSIIYLIEGLTPWLRKNRTLFERQYAAAVRGSGSGDGPDAQQPPPSTARRCKPKANEPQEYVNPDGVEDALLQLQVLHGALIHHTAAAVETAKWIAVFTQHISTVPYRRQREESNAAAAGFCMDTGQVRTGDGAKDTYVRMLQEIARVTAPIAWGVAGEFDTVAELVRGLEDEGPLCLEAVRKGANKDGAVSDRAVGQAVSRRIHKIFTGKDETSTDV
ncbi:ERCC4 domain-containing protein [Podospora appendiculata]|uniref:ERCC4 domain-containing protein n=1 Tax=Podospora appendiculata TaxID=314037 RepID=A0AAE0X2Q0_9PEZI|nr:ERCC4 domain-containing protein [Podospora appendiculata]